MTETSGLLDWVEQLLTARRNRLARANGANLVDPTKRRRVGGTTSIRAIPCRIAHFSKEICG